MKKYALCTAQAEISTTRIRHAVEDDNMTIFEGAYADGYTGDANKTVCVYNDMDVALAALSARNTYADIAYTGWSKVLQATLVWVEEREYDEDGEYELTGNEWQAKEQEV